VFIMGDNDANDLDLDLLGDDESGIGEGLVGNEANGDALPGSAEIDFSKGINVPPELKPLVDEINKGMRTAYIQKTQELANLRKQISAGSANQAEREKAVMLDNLLRDPNIMNYLAQVQAGVGSDSDEDDSEDPSMAQVKKILSPVQRELAELRDAARYQAALREKEVFEKAHPNWEQEVGKVGMEESFKKNPNLTIEEAYDLAIVRKLRSAQASKKSKEDNSGKVVEGRGSGRKTIEEPKITSFEDAKRFALKQAGYDPNKVL
jgi:hypothetical protein